MHKSEESVSFLSLHETESYVESLNPFLVDEIGTLKWFNQHEALERLNMQALLEVKMQMEESVQEKFVLFDKAPLLVELLVAQDLWKEFVFPIVVRLLQSQAQAFPTYMVLYNSVTIVSLLETLTFRQSFCENLDERASDLVDFCHASIVKIITKGSHKHLKQQQNKALHPKEEVSSDNRQQLLQQNFDIEMILSAKSLGILCHLIQHASSICLSAISRMCNHHDIPVFLADLLQQNPWKVRENDSVHKFIDGEWKEISDNDQNCLTQTEGQLWMALHQCMLGSEFRGKYYLNEHRKSRLLKVRPLLNEMILDQIPGLADVQRCLDMLSFMETPMPKKGLIIEQPPVVRERLHEVNKNRWDQLARYHVNALSADHGLLKSIAGRMSEIYAADAIDPVLPEPAKCACCGYPASRKCSSCKAEWYCRRECQVKHWSKHKDACKLLAPPGDL